jgi:cytoplasmic iron level regulating protein YaaA (DUF328/UPF0246 family)
MSHRRALNGVKEMLPKRMEALDAFRAAMDAGREAQTILGLKGKPFQEALAINRAIGTSALAPVLERSCQAFATTLTDPPLAAGANRRLLRDVLFVCPLLGVLRPNDLVPDYRCPVGASLPRIGSLHRHWKHSVTATLNRLLKGAQVFSLLPARLNALWKPDGREAGIVVLRFSRMYRGRCIGETAGVPRLSGEALRFILERDVRTARDVMQFQSSHGHAYSAIQSVERERVQCLNFVLDRARASAPSSG